MIIVVVFIIAMQRRMRLAWEILVIASKRCRPTRNGRHVSHKRHRRCNRGGRSVRHRRHGGSTRHRRCNRGGGGCCPRWDCKDSWGPGISHWTNRRNRDGVGSSE